MSNTATGLPRQPPGSPSRRHPGADGQKRNTRQWQRGGWREGSKTSLETTGSGSASCRVASKKPVDRPCPRRGEGGQGFLRLEAEPCFWQLLGHSWPACLGTASAPLSMSKGQDRHSRGVQSSQQETSVRDTQHAVSPICRSGTLTHRCTHAHTHAHTHALTSEPRTQS